MQKLLLINMHDDNIIHIEELVKRYGKITAVDDISLDVKRGEMFGLVGPDGAGKTSTIRVLCGLTNFDSGDISLLDQSLRDSKNEIQKQIGYLSQKFSLYGDLTVDENIEFFADIHNVKNYKARRDELLDFTRLKKFRTRYADNLSGGMKQKLALACSLIHKPQIIFLDEPTTGVDPVSRRDFWKILSGLLKEGITIFMSTPYLDEAERCNRVAMMNKGKIIAMEKPDIIKTSIGKVILEIVCSPVREAFNTLRKNTIYDIQLFGDRINVVIDSFEKEYPEIKKTLIKNSVEIKDSRTVTPTLENVFMYLIKTAS